MKKTALLIFFPVIAFAQGRGGGQGGAQAGGAQMLAHGQDIFNRSCATGYCHGVKGAAGGAPRLAARAFDDAYVRQVVRNGIPHTGMPEFGSSLEPTDLAAVVAYVDSLNGVTPPANPFAGGPTPRRLPPEAQRGRRLFADQVRGLVRCSTCHQADNVGIAVTLPFTSVPDSVAALRGVATPQIESAMVGADRFPALVLNKAGAQTKMYDLTSTPPVLRTIPKADVKFESGSNWNHADMLKPYTDQELDSILTFLRAAVKPE